LTAVCIADAEARRRVWSDWASRLYWVVQWRFGFEMEGFRLVWEELDGRRKAARASMAIQSFWEGVQNLVVIDIWKVWWWWTLNLGSEPW